MARRGEELKKHILWEAKNVFLELGFERASMDLIAVRASTSKRSLYAHFSSKDVLYRSVIELARTLYLDKLKTPDAYAEDDVEAVVVFCARFLQLLLREPALRTSRMGVAEAERLPEASNDYYDAIFGTSHQRLAGFLAERPGLTTGAPHEVADELLGRVLYPRYLRALLGVEAPLPAESDEVSLAKDVDTDRIRAVVHAVLAGAGNASGGYV